VAVQDFRTDAPWMPANRHGDDVAGKPYLLDHGDNELLTGLANLVLPVVGDNHSRGQIVGFGYLKKQFPTLLAESQRGHWNFAHALELAQPNGHCNRNLVIAPLNPAI